MDFIELNFEPIDVDMQSPLVWAYIGDAVYEMFIRTYLVKKSTAKPNKLHIESIKYVKAQAQANILKKLDEILTEKEKDIVRRGRNAESHHLPKNSNAAEYSQSTAFEALIGYLYLNKSNDRLKEILNFAISE